ncbi:bifunctional metallophosphatase/5'-nucleotidase [Haloarchaeobius iranensis]|uniref:2',3'-cyclic-nucleotide 2'-phosphodiesterase/5'-or 3'-nucleotidase, 5'-nucleotidase family n=1 Tax=Haloarchaeobius iranensis TaxID=996166 RepID=A0A1G9VWP6_9EURY|nr:bifunctional metallophosphatase/5'-nucleotidase [Haloarchaeobius iranensis]SDM76699.1 2',3'-cyclic-nucleotide 2'-phosphodiesterase/5'-or 3'-nucleotidase, 5'-nucleotidase family [Haloarchaeobius iranensis]
MTLRLLHYADLEAAYDVPERVGRLATAVRERRDDRTVVTGGGDDTGPCVLSFEADGGHAETFLDAVAPDVETFGNHEFDGTLDRARRFAAETPPTWLCANLYAGDGNGDGRFAADATEPWTVVDTAAGPVGLFGVTTPALGDIKPGIGLDGRDPVAAAREAVDALRDAGVEYVVGVSHCGDDDPIARGVDVDVVLGGHVHEPRDDVVAGTRLVRPGAAGSHLVEVRIDDDGATETRFHDVDDHEPAPGLTADLRDQLAAVGLDDVVTHVDGTVNRRAREPSPVGTFVAEAFRRAGDADVGLVNSRTMRDCGVPLSGAVRRVDLHSLVPFPAGLVTLALDGTELRSVVAEAGEGHRDQDGARWNGQFAGIEVDWDVARDRPAGVTVAGAPLDPDATYHLTTIRYLVVEDVEFPTITEANVVEDAGGLHEAMVAHAERVGIPTEPVEWFRRVGPE